MASPPQMLPAGVGAQGAGWGAKAQPHAFTGQASPGSSPGQPDTGSLPGMRGLGVGAGLGVEAGATERAAQGPPVSPPPRLVGCRKTCCSPPSWEGGVSVRTGWPWAPEGTRGLSSCSWRGRAGQSCHGTVPRPACPWASLCHALSCSGAVLVLSLLRMERLRHKKGMHTSQGQMGV